MELIHNCQSVYLSFLNSFQIYEANFLFQPFAKQQLISRRHEIAIIIANYHGLDGIINDRVPSALKRIAAMIIISLAIANVYAFSCAQITLLAKKHYLLEFEMDYVFELFAHAVI